MTIVKIDTMSEKLTPEETIAKLARLKEKIMENQRKGTANDDFYTRQHPTNEAEIMFEKWATEKGYKVFRVGFDEKNKQLEYFYRINPMLRNLPDFIIEKDEKSYVINVKGSPNIKEKEVQMIPEFIQHFSSHDCPLMYCFSFPGDGVYYWLTAQAVIDRYKQAGKDKNWADGKIYRTINLDR